MLAPQHIGLPALAAMALTTAITLAADPAVWTPPPPLSPADSLKTIEVPDGFAVELVAAEPLVLDPVAIAWGPEGKLWVVEMADYNHLPINDKSPAKPQGRVVYLTDTDGNGKYDKRTIFLDDLNYPTGVMPWRGGVLVTTAPDILYAEDTTPDDGNGKADKREVLYTGFIEGNPQLRVNGLRWGLDGWIYCANGLSNGVVKSTKTGKTLDIRGRDLRIKPDTGDLDAASGPSQFGRVRDDFGNWFGVDNSRLIIHYVLEDHYLRRNPYVAAPEPYIDLVTPRNPPCYARGKKVDRLHAPYMANRFTSACGIEVYRDTLLGDDVYGQVFVCEPVHNLVTRRVLTEDGVTFKAKRVQADDVTAFRDTPREFLDSTDEWFRPVQVRTGPDGALYVVDMYRAVIEHPQWLPADFNKKVDWMAGSDKGRIYRVVRKKQPPRVVQRLDKLDGKGLVAALDSPNGYQRDLAHMMLVWRGAANFATAATTLLGKDRLPAIRAQVLSVLSETNETEPADLMELVVSGQPNLVKHAIRVGERSGKNELPEAFHLVPGIGKSRTSAVDLQLALSLGECPSQEASKMLTSLLLQYQDDSFISSAMWSAGVPHVDSIVKAVLQTKEAPGKLLGAIAATAVGGLDMDRIAIVLVAACDHGDGRNGFVPYGVEHYHLLASIIDELEKKGYSLRKLHELPNERLKEAIENTRNLMAAARIVVERGSGPSLEDAVRLFGRGHSDDEDITQPLIDVFRRAPENAVTEAIILRLGRNGNDDWPNLMPLRVYNNGTPEIRKLIIDVLLRRPAWTKHLLLSVASKDISPNELSLTQRQGLLIHPEADIRQQAAALFDRPNPDRVKVLAAHQDVLTMKGDLDRGREHFEKTCAVCHRLAGAGKGYGPDLASLTDRSAASLLEAILDPNKAVDSRYVNYVAETAEGETFTGIVLNETGNSVTMAGADGVKRAILRKDLTSLRATNLSIMPEGLEQGLGKQGLADVMAFVAHKIQPPRVLAGVKAAVVLPGSDGSLVLPATQCEAFGTTIVYEKEDNNLGQWSKADDYVAWSIEPREAGEYEVWFDYACDAAWKGNRFSLVVEAEGEEPVRVEGEVAVTGTLDDYRQVKVGVAALNRKRSRVTVRAAASVTGRLMDLRGIRLAPVGR